MKIGVNFPQTEIGTDIAVLRDFAQAAEDLGFSHIIALDHVLGADHSHRWPALSGLYDISDPVHEPLTLFAFLAGVTERVELASGVLVLPQRQTALAAKQAAQIAILSNYRFRLGVGVGWNYVEFEALDSDFRSRGRRVEEQVEVLRLLWSEPVVDYTGHWHRISRAGILPRPVSPIPIWFGGFGETALDRAVRIGQGFICTRSYVGGRTGTMSASLDDTLAKARALDEKLSRAGRERTSFGIEARVNFRDGIETLRRELQTLETVGVDYVALNTMRADLESPRAHILAIEKFAQEFGLGSS